MPELQVIAQPDRFAVLLEDRKDDGSDYARHERLRREIIRNRKRITEDGQSPVCFLDFQHSSHCACSLMEPRQTETVFLYDA